MTRVNEIEPAYRAPMAARSGERRTRRLMLIGAAASFGVFAAVLGLRELLGGARAPREVPLVSADDRPTRVRPDNPGGMTVPNQDKLIFERASGRSTAPQQAALAPPPEAPQAPPRTAPPPPAQAAPAPAPAAATPAPQGQPAQGQPAQAQPAQAQQAAARLPPPTPAAQGPAAQPPAVGSAPPASAAPAAPSGRIAVQLAAVGTREEAMAEWERLKRRAPEYLGNRRPQVVPLERDGKTFFRLRTDGFADQATARGFCEQLRARGLSCFVPSA